MALLSPYFAALYSVSLPDLNAVERAHSMRHTWLLIHGFWLGNFFTCGCQHKCWCTQWHTLHIPVCQGKIVLQGALSLWCPKFNLFGDRVCLFESLSVGWVQEQRDVVWESKVGAGCSLVCATYVATIKSASGWAVSTTLKTSWSLPRDAMELACGCGGM